MCVDMSACISRFACTCVVLHNPNWNGAASAPGAGEVNNWGTAAALAPPAESFSGKRARGERQEVGGGGGVRGTGTVCVGGRGWRGGGANIGVWWLGSAPGAPSRGMPTCRPRGAGSAGTAGGSAATCSSIVASALRRLADAASAPHNVHPWSGPTRSASRSWLLRHHLGIGRLLAQVRGRRRERRRERRAALPHRRHRRRALAGDHLDGMLLLHRRLRQVSCGRGQGTRRSIVGPHSV